MSFSNSDLPGNFSVSKSVEYSSSGVRLSNHVQDSSKQLSLTIVSVQRTGSNFTISENNGTRMYLDVNPKNFSISMSKAVDAGNYTRAGYIPQFWGEELDVISVQGTTAAFLHADKGLTRQEAGDTTGYKNFMNLVALYKNNGSVFHTYGTSSNPSAPPQNGPNTLSKIRNGYKSNSTSQNAFVSSSLRKVVDKRNLIRLTYATLEAYGTFDTFNWSDAEEKPFNFDYSFEFTVLFYNELPSKIDGHF